MSGHSVASWFFDECYSDGIDLAWEEMQLEIASEVKAANPDASEEEIEDMISEASENCENDRSYFLLGAWVKNDKGQYEIDTSGKAGSFACSYNSDSNTVTVEWSETVVSCHHTSPCFVMADGSGPCGDLDTAGDSVQAFALPASYLATAENGEG